MAKMGTRFELDEAKTSQGKKNSRKTVFIFLHFHSIIIETLRHRYTEPCFIYGQFLFIFLRSNSLPTNLTLDCP